VRLRTVLGAVAVASLALVAIASPAAAVVPDENLTIDAPERISVGASATSVPWTITGTPYAMETFIGIMGVMGSADFLPQDIAFAYAGRTTGRLWIEAKDVVPGVYNVDLLSASDITAEEGVDGDFATTGDDIVVKWTGNAALSVARKSSAVTITATARRFSNASTWVSLPGAKLTFQRYSSGAWRTIKTTTAGTGGKAVLKVTTNTAYSYRVLQGETTGTTATWADYSATVKK
jgi:hypothetical protein